ncbi:MAG: class I mannose-6-phosphate isomerase [Bacteroidaceae bacterium]|nr:class I mannose-6-phosphate isomerase [Bacteroidaceae bacterium]MBP3407693.1 class I mannose-6-phosphate isomerase [Bacteroidaceae bacterium]
MYKFKPILKSMLWGGEKIIPYKGVESTMTSVGESWEISGVKDNESVVAEGPDAGMKLPELIARDKGALVGQSNYERFGKEFPLLIKFIDARQDLSIQVHPNDKLAWERHQSKGKTEMWYVVDADPGSRLRSGFAKQVTPDEYEQSIADNTITDLLQEYDIHAGDVFFLPAGRVHSIGAGAFIAEIQQTSNITYRIYDFNRCDDSGKPRELHTELSKAAIDYTVLPDYRTYYEAKEDAEVQLAACRYFTTSLCKLTKEYRMDIAELDSFVILICTKGNGTVTDDCGNCISIKQGESILVPATAKTLDIVPACDMELLSSWVKE